jgi:hypothetical protein
MKGLGTSATVDLGEPLMTVHLRLLTVLLLLASCPLLAQEATLGARDLYLSFNDEQAAAPAKTRPAGKPGIKVSIELQRDGRTSRVPTEYAFRSGDLIRLHLETNFDGHIRVINHGSSGAERQLFPYDGVSSQVRKNVVKTIPESKNDWIAFDHRPGVERLRFYLSRKPMPQQPSLWGEGIPQRPAAGSSTSVGGAASATEEDEILAVLNSRDLFILQSSADANFAVTSLDVLEETVGFELKLTHVEK